MMSENHICAAAKAMAQTYTTASVPLYGKKLRGQRSVHCFQQFCVRFYVPTFHRKNPEFVNISPENRRIHLTTPDPEGEAI